MPRHYTHLCTKANPLVADGDDYGDLDDITDPHITQLMRSKRTKENPMAKRTMSMAAVVGALKSSKTPARLKEGLLRRFGAQLQGAKLPMSALKSNPAIVDYDVFITREGNKWVLDYPAKAYTGAFAATAKGKAQLKAFLKPAIDMGLKIKWEK